MKKLAMGVGRIVASILGVALAVGIQSPLAIAAASVAGGGVGYGSSSTFSLASGLYEVHVSYNGNADSGDARYFSLFVRGANGDRSLLVSNISAEGDQRSIYAIQSSGTYWLDVEDAVSTASWSFEITRLTAPRTVSTTYVGSGVGPGSAPLVRLAEGSYKATMTYTGNTDTNGPDDFYMSLQSDSGGATPLADDEGSDGRTVTKVFQVDRTGVYWVDCAFVTSLTRWNFTITSLAKPITSVAKPKISGKAKVGKMLKVKPGKWTPSDVHFTYQWIRGRSSIGGATRVTYKLKAKDKDKKISVLVTGSKSGYIATTVASKPTAKVKK